MTSTNKQKRTLIVVLFVSLASVLILPHALLLQSSSSTSNDASNWQQDFVVSSSKQRHTLLVSTRTNSTASSSSSRFSTAARNDIALPPLPSTKAAVANRTSDGDSISPSNSGTTPHTTTHPDILHNTTALKPASADTNNNKTLITVPLTLDHFFWKGRQKRLCKLIQNVTSTYSTKDFTILLNFTTSCHSIHHKMHVGTGNLVLALYGMRLAAVAGRVDFLFCCSETDHEYPRSQHVLPWLQGYYPAQEYVSPFGNNPTLKQAAHGMGYCPLHYMIHEIRRDLQRMARNVTIPHSLDDVAIHVRCGDVVRGLPSHDYGLLAFDTYRKYINHTVKSIGIITSSFNESHVRPHDKGMTHECAFLVHGMVQYLKRVFPRVQVTVRAGEALPVAYARLMLAKQSFCGPSTFSLFPALATLHKSYIQAGRVNYFVQEVAEKYPDYVVALNSSLLTSLQMKSMDPISKLEWLIRPYCQLDWNSTKHDINLKCGDNTTTSVVEK